MTKDTRCLQRAQCKFPFRVTVCEARMAQSFNWTKLWLDIALRNKNPPRATLNQNQRVTHLLYGDVSKVGLISQL